MRLGAGGCRPPQPHLAAYEVPPMQKLMMLGTYKEKHKEMGSFPIRGGPPMQKLMMLGTYKENTRKWALFP